MTLTVHPPARITPGQACRSWRAQPLAHPPPHNFGSLGILFASVTMAVERTSWEPRRPTSSSLPLEFFLWFLGVARTRLWETPAIVSDARRVCVSLSETAGSASKRGERSLVRQEGAGQEAYGDTGLSGQTRLKMRLAKRTWTIVLALNKA